MTSDVITKPRLFNWRCPTCNDWRGIGSMNDARHCRECGTRCQWVEYRVCFCGAAMKPDHDERPEIVYLATPYSDQDPAVREARFHAVNKAAADLMRRGVHVYSPISHSHAIAEAGDLPKDWAYWEQYDRAFLAICTKMVVLRLDGWDRSTGVAAEMAIASEMGLPIEFIDP